MGEEGGGAEDEALFQALAQPGVLEMVRAYNEISDPRARAALLALAQELAADRR